MTVRSQGQNVIRLRLSQRLHVASRQKLFDRFKHYYTSIACWADAVASCASRGSSMPSLPADVPCARIRCGASLPHPHPLHRTVRDLVAAPPHFAARSAHAP